ncbi:MAG: hypothetical protein KZQ60_19480 [Candidatus Thiodiazotropha sp. (ex Lucinoma aequizonata)]|nr:hypothetical protein [Candidatus Thiodiazotropha sp. (ex Lucinoma aequizonata)]
MGHPSPPKSTRSLTAYCAPTILRTSRFRIALPQQAYSIMTTAMTLRRLGCALCMPFISPFRSPFRPYNRAYAYRGLTAFAPLSMAVSDRRSGRCWCTRTESL